MSYILDPQAKDLMEKAEAAGRPALESLDAVAARIQFAEMTGAVAIDPVEVDTVTNRTIPGPAGDIPVRIYHPGGGVRPVLVYLHGGGYVVGDLDTHDPVCRKLCQEANLVVVSVDYRLAPEHPFPAAVDDTMAAVRWVAANAAEIGADADRLAVGGDSAGGNLTCVATQFARDEGGPDIKFQLLVYPATDKSLATQSHKELGEGYRLTRSMIDWFYDNYVPEGADINDPRLSPGKATSFANLPPAFVMTAGFDPLRDEAIEYADAMKAAGVPVQYRCYEGMIHGFFQMGGWLDVSREAVSDASVALKAALG